MYAQKKIILLYRLSAKKRSNPISMNTDTTSTVVFIAQINRNSLVEEGKYYEDSLMQNFVCYRPTSFHEIS